MYSTSHGCPYNCGYCSNASVYGRNLDVLPVEQVVEEVTWLAGRYGIELMGLIDDIFLPSGAALLRSPRVLSVRD